MYDEDIETKEGDEIEFMPSNPHQGEWLIGTVKKIWYPLLMVEDFNGQEYWIEETWSKISKYYLIYYSSYLTSCDATEQDGTTLRRILYHLNLFNLNPKNIMLFKVNNNGKDKWIHPNDWPFKVVSPSEYKWEMK
jgi:hypothetical protein